MSDTEIAAIVIIIAYCIVMTIISTGMLHRFIDFVCDLRKDSE